ncbi:MAG: M28 family peptidase [Nocardioides sp.]
MARVRSVAVVLGAAVLAGACSDPSEDESGSLPRPVTSSTSSASTPPQPPQPPATAAPTEPVREPRLSADDVDVRTALGAVDVLAGRIGPRPGHSPAYFKAAGWVERQLTSFGWQVERQQFPTPGGVSWGVPVESGPSVNLVATRGDITPGEPWLAVGAHLDAVPQSPGAEDNASGIGVLLALAEAAAERQTRLPVVLIAFGSEEPRGPSDDDHHYGSRAYVAALSAKERRTLRGMVSLDRVGVGDVVPVGSPAEPNALTDALQEAGRADGVPTVFDPFQRSSDHWSFAREGLPGARLGSTSYVGYHSARDVPSVVEPAQLERTARLVAHWLR